MKTVKIFLTVLYFLSFFNFSYSQTLLRISTVDTLNKNSDLYKVDFYYLDTTGGNFTIKYIYPNNISIDLAKKFHYKIVKIKQQKQLNVNVPTDVMLILDVSGSMWGRRLSWEIEAAKTFVEMAPDNFKISIVIFNHNSYLIQDFTKDKTLLINVLNSLFAFGGTDFNYPIYQNKSASIEKLYQRKAKRKLAIFLTDGYGYYNGNNTEILKKMKKHNVSFYAIGVETFIPDKLILLAKNSGGFVYKYTDKYGQIEQFYQNIILSTKVIPGSITFQLELDSCKNFISDKEFLNFEIDSFRVSKEITNVKILKSVKLNYTLVDFGYVPVGMQVEREITINASNQKLLYIKALDTSEIKIRTNLKPGSFLKKGHYYKMKIIYKPKDTIFKVNQIKLGFDKCKEKKITIYYGKPNKALTFNSLKVEYPNGGEQFFVGEKINVKWSGIAKKDSVKIFLTTDGGKNYLYKATGNNFISLMILPFKRTKNAKVKIVHKLNGYFQYLAKNVNLYPSALADGYQFVGINNKNLVYFNYLTKSQEKIPLKEKNTIKFLSAENSYIAFATSKKVYIYNNKVNVEKKKFSNIEYLSLLNDSLLAVKSGKFLYLWNFTKSEIQKFPLKHKPDNLLINKTLDTFYYSFARKLYFFDTKNNKYRQIAKYSTIHRKKDGYLLLTQDKAIVFYDIKKRKFDTLLPKFDKISYIKDFDIFGDKLYILGYKVSIYDLKKKQILHSFTAKNASTLKNIKIIDNGFRIVMWGRGVIEVWSDMTNFMEQDESDAPFEIKSIDLEVIDTIYLPQTYTHYSLNKVVENVLINKSKINLVVKKVSITSLTEATFYLGTEKNNTPLYGKEAFSVEIVYNSPNAGIDSALLSIEIADTVFNIKVYASAIDPPLELINKFIDFGTILKDKKKYQTVPLLKNTTKNYILIEKVILLGNTNNFDIKTKLTGKLIKPGETIKLNAGLIGNDIGSYDLIMSIWVKNMSTPLIVVLSGRVRVIGQVIYNIQIKDALTNKPIKGATVRASTTGLRTQTTYVRKGKAALKLKINKKYDIEISAPNYYSENYSISIPKKVYQSEFDTIIYLIPKRKNDTVSIFTFHFQTGKSLLDKNELDKFQKIIVFFKRNPRIQIILEGHTDNEGTFSKNRILSKERAETVKKLLVNQGVEKERIIVRGFADTKPIAENKTEEGKQKNRRVEVKYFVK